MVIDASPAMSSAPSSSSSKKQKQRNGTFLKRLNKNKNNKNTDTVISSSNRLSSRASSFNLAASTAPQYKNGLLRSKSSVDTACDDYNQQLLHKAVEDAGRWAYGVIVAEVWCIADDQTRLYRPAGGYWFDPTYHEECPGEDCHLCRLFDTEKHNYAHPRHVAPGEGLPGALWAEVSVGNWSRNHRESLAKSIMNASTNDKEFRHEITLTHFRTRHIAWRNVQQLHDDPDQPWNLRLKLLAELGLGWAAAVPFSMHGSRGIVIYMARDNVDMDRLQSERNEVYLRAATDLIGAASAFGEPRRAAVLARRRELLTTLHRVRDKILTIHRKGLSLKDFVEQEAETQVKVPHDHRRARHFELVTGAGHNVGKRASMVVAKAKGAGLPAPPAFGWTESFFTFLCVLVTMSTLTFLHDYIRNDAGDDYAVAIGPNGALMCLLFGLTSAPASQPRNAIIGQAISMTISLSIAASEDIPLFLRQGLATALAIAVMAKLGVTHPPAAASAAIYASGLVNWPSMGFLLVANLIAITLATAFNNLSSKRQYPTYWGIQPFWLDVKDGCQTVMIAICSACGWLRPLPRVSNHSVPHDLSSSSKFKSKTGRALPDSSTDRVNGDRANGTSNEESFGIQQLDP